MPATGIDRWLGQPYFFVPPHDATSVKTKIAATGAYRLNLEMRCILNNYE